MLWILDLDGVVWLADTPIVGATDAVEDLRRRGDDVRFLTNNSSLTVAQYRAKLGHAGVIAHDDDIFTSAQAVATMIEPGERALVCGGAGVGEALSGAGARLVREAPVDAVVVGWHRDFDFEEMARAATAVRAGARLLATNDDATYPTPDGPLPGCGAILAAIVTASGAPALIAGKPHAPMAELLRRRLGDRLLGATLVGDRPDTDGLMARRLGVRFALVLSGITGRADLPVDPAPDVVADDLARLVSTAAEA